jgi:hypothetical protein
MEEFDFYDLKIYATKKFNDQKDYLEEKLAYENLMKKIKDI